VSGGSHAPLSDRRSPTTAPDRSGLASKAMLDILDAGLEGSDLFLEGCEVAREDFAPAALVAEMCFDPAQRLRDCVVLPLESFEAPVNLVEVPEHLASQPDHLASQLDDLTIDSVEAVVDLGEPPIDLGELASEELDELFVLGGGHGP
jgi:hypothetical protein